MQNTAFEMGGLISCENRLRAGWGTGCHERELNRCLMGLVTHYYYTYKGRRISAGRETNDAAIPSIEDATNLPWPVQS